MFKSRKKLFKESVSSVRNEIRDMFEDIKDGLEAARNAGSDLSDIMVVVETWDQGAPVLVKGAYNYYSGDIRCSADEFVDDHDDLIRDYMKEFDDEVKERNDMLDDILNKMYDDVENGDMDEEDYQEEQMNLIDDTCTWSVSVTLGKGNDEIKSTMAVNIESGDADVLDTDTLSVDEVERWAKKKSESRISRRRGIRRVLEKKQDALEDNVFKDFCNQYNKNHFEQIDIKPVEKDEWDLKVYYTFPEYPKDNREWIYRIRKVSNNLFEVNEYNPYYKKYVGGTKEFELSLDNDYVFGLTEMLKEICIEEVPKLNRIMGF